MALVGIWQTFGSLITRIECQLPSSFTQKKSTKCHIFLVGIYAVRFFEFHSRDLKVRQELLKSWKFHLFKYLKFSTIGHRKLIKFNKIPQFHELLFRFHETCANETFRILITRVWDSIYVEETQKNLPHMRLLKNDHIII